MILRATLQDVPALTKLVNSAYRGESSKKGWTTEAHLLEGIRTTEAELTQLINLPNHQILHYSKEGEILGCVLLIIKEHQLYLGMLSVNPSLQNSGIGKKLLQTAEDFARTNQLPAIEMTVIGLRTELIAWYQRNGYQDTGKRLPFPESNDFHPLTLEPLTFMVLEKKI